MKRSPGIKRRRTARALVAVGAALLVACGALVALNMLMATAAARPQPSPFGAAPDQPDAAPGGVCELASASPVDWDYWLAVNPAIVGWVEIPGTAVSQPVVRAPADDPRFYLKHDVYGNWNLYGCPYLDAGCENGLDSPNAVIMGHNISLPPAMFHDLQAYHDPDFASAHLRVNVYTPDGARAYTVAGVHTVDGDEPVKRVRFEDQADFQGYCSRRLQACDARYAGSEAGADGPVQMLTLCSCSYFFNPRNERTLVYALRGVGASAVGGSPVGVAPGGPAPGG